MEKKTLQKLLDVQETTMQDGQYQHLADEHKYLNARFLSVMESISQAQQDAVYDYIGVIIAMHLRMLEIACG